jgi:hypothetical protein
VTISKTGTAISTRKELVEAEETPKGKLKLEI